MTQSTPPAIKPQKTQPVRGTHDLLGIALAQQQLIIKKAQDVASRFGYQEIATPIFEFSEVFHRTLGETSDIIHKETYTFTDRGGDSLTLRPEGTAAIARAFLSNGLQQDLPVRLFYQGPMFRYERPQKGRLRQFHQVGAELLGIAEPPADIESLSLAWLFLQTLGLTHRVRLHLNTLGDGESRRVYRDALVAFFTARQGHLSKDSQERLKTNPLRILDSKDEGDRQLVTEAPKLGEFLTPLARNFFHDVQTTLTAMEIPFTLDPQLVRGLDYYSHTVFEFRSAELGAQDAVLSGGRYDHLIQLMGGPDVPGVGWAAGLERLALLVPTSDDRPSPTALIPIGERAERQALSLAHHLRAAGLIIELSYSGNLGKRMKKAAKSGASRAVIFGDNELDRDEYLIKDMVSGEQKTVPSSSLRTALTP